MVPSRPVFLAFCKLSTWIFNYFYLLLLLLLLLLTWDHFAGKCSKMTYPSKTTHQINFQKRMHILPWIISTQITFRILKV